MRSEEFTCAGPLYRAAVVGCGRIGSAFGEDLNAAGVLSHAQAYHLHPRVELVGLSDVDSSCLERARARWRAAADPDPVAMCRRVRPDIVSLCTPDETHHPLAMRLLAEAPPRIIFMEKPLALSSSEGEEILQMAERVGCAVAVNYSRRYSPAFRAIASELRSGAHGRPVLFRLLYGKGLLHNGSHAIDLVRFWLGEPLGGTATPVAWGPPGDPTCDVELTCADGCRVRLEGFDERVATIFEGDLLTEKSRWRFSLGGQRWERFEVRDSPVYAGYRNYLPVAEHSEDSRFRDPLRDCLRTAVENVVAFLDGRAALACSGEEALASLRWVERVRWSPS